MKRFLQVLLAAVVCVVCLSFMAGVTHPHTHQAPVSSLTESGCSHAVLTHDFHDPIGENNPNWVSHREFVARQSGYREIARSQKSITYITLSENANPRCMDLLLAKLAPWLVER